MLKTTYFSDEIRCLNSVVHSLRSRYHVETFVRPAYDENIMLSDYVYMMFIRIREDLELQVSISLIGYQCKPRKTLSEILKLIKERESK